MPEAKNTEKLSSFHVAILVYMTQSGIFVFSLPQLLAEHFGTNGWVALLLYSLVAMANILMISAVYRLSKGRSVFEIMEQNIPRWLLFPLYAFLIAVWSLIGCLVVKEYVLIFRMVAFPTTNPMWFKLIVDALAFFLVIKGLYNIAKAATIFFWLIVWMNVLQLFFYNDFSWTRLTPFLFRGGDYNPLGIFNIYSAFLGYELILLQFKYVNQKTRLIRSALIGNALVTVVYVSFSFISFGFFSFDQLKVVMFPMLDLLAYIKLPFVERIENLLYGVFLFTTLMSMVIYTWAANETAGRMVPKIKPNVRVFVLILVSFIFSFIPDILDEVTLWLSRLSLMSMGIAFGLPLVLLLALGVERAKGGERHA